MHGSIRGNARSRRCAGGFSTACASDEGIERVQGGAGLVLDGKMGHELKSCAMNKLAATTVSPVLRRQAMLDPPGQHEVLFHFLALRLVQCPHPHGRAHRNMERMRAVGFFDASVQEVGPQQFFEKGRGMVQRWQGLGPAFGVSTRTSPLGHLLGDAFGNVGTQRSVEVQRGVGPAAGTPGLVQE